MSYKIEVPMEVYSEWSSSIEWENGLGVLMAAGEFPDVYSKFLENRYPEIVSAGWVVELGGFGGIELVFESEEMYQWFLLRQ